MICKLICFIVICLRLPLQRTRVGVCLASLSYYFHVRFWIFQFLLLFDMFSLPWSRVHSLSHFAIWNAYKLFLKVYLSKPFTITKKLQKLFLISYVFLFVLFFTPLAIPGPRPLVHRTFGYALRRTFSVLISLWDQRQDDVFLWSHANICYHPSPSLDNKILWFR